MASKLVHFETLKLQKIRQKCYSRDFYIPMVHNILIFLKKMTTAVVSLTVTEGVEVSQDNPQSPSASMATLATPYDVADNVL